MQRWAMVLSTGRVRSANFVELARRAIYAIKFPARIAPLDAQDAYYKLTGNVECRAAGILDRDAPVLAFLRVAPRTQSEAIFCGHLQR